MRKVFVLAVWAFISLCVVAIITLPVNLQTQLIASLLIVTLMAVIKLVNAGGRWRLIALAFGTAVVLRYVYWRTTGTLPPINQPENFIPGFLLYLAEMYSVMMLALSLFVVAMPLPPRPSRAATPGNYPKVDVFVPSYNGRISPCQHARGSQRHGLSGRQAHGVVARRRRYTAEAEIDKSR